MNSMILSVFKSQIGKSIMFLKDALVTRNFSPKVD